MFAFLVMIVHFKESTVFKTPGSRQDSHMV